MKICSLFDLELYGHLQFMRFMKVLDYQVTAALHITGVVKGEDTVLNFGALS